MHGPNNKIQPMLFEKTGVTLFILETKRNSMIVLSARHAVM
jgi:hypothetical protein